MLPQKIRFAELVAHLPEAVRVSLPDVMIAGIALDSRQVQPGYLFVALEGGSQDGHLFIPDALRRGAAAVVGTQDLDTLPVPYLRVADARRALAALSAAFFGFPARKLRVVGVTGTDGKTTTTNLIYSILKTAGVPAGMVSTVNARIGGRVLDTGFHVTTPEAPDLQKYLAQMVAAGLTHAVLEATSHGLEQQRVSACEFDVAVVTNITHEHLDYHGSYRAYREAKGRLFSALAVTTVKEGGNPRLAVLNRDDDSYPYLSELVSALTPPVRAVSYGQHPEADIRAEAIVSGPSGIRFNVVQHDRSHPVESRLIGAYNASNCLAALAAAVEGLEMDWETAAAGVAALENIPGRMEAIDLGPERAAARPGNSPETGFQPVDRRLRLGGAARPGQAAHDGGGRRGAGRSDGADCGGSPHRISRIDPGGDGRRRRISGWGRGADLLAGAGPGRSDPVRDLAGESGRRGDRLRQRPRAVDVLRGGGVSLGRPDRHAGGAGGKARHTGPGDALPSDSRRNFVEAI